VHDASDRQKQLRVAAIDRERRIQLSARLGAVVLVQKERGDGDSRLRPQTVAPDRFVVGTKRVLEELRIVVAQVPAGVADRDELGGAEIGAAVVGVDERIELPFRSLAVATQKLDLAEQGASLEIARTAAFGLAREPLGGLVPAPGLEKQPSEGQPRARGRRGAFVDRRAQVRLGLFVLPDPGPHPGT
jgi:hypothetical protein